jgi:uncharacterized protein with HEPN domain
MSPEDSPLLDILEAASSAIAFLDPPTEEEFYASTLHQYAVARALEIVGEASKKVPGDARDRLPDLPWSKMVALRNRLSHQYGDINPRILWDIVKNDLPALADALRPLGEEPPE